MIRISKLRLNKLMMLLSKVPPPKLLIVMNNNSSRKRLHSQSQHRSKIKNPLKLTSKILRPRRQNRLVKPPYLMQMLNRIKLIKLLLQEVTRHQLIKLSSRQRLMS
jgi:hypothetical protein